MLKHFLFLIPFYLFFCVPMAHATSFISSASVNVTSDTIVNAKKMAMAEARRQIINDVLGTVVSNPEKFSDVMADAKDSDLASLVSSLNITGEQTSDTTYSATIKMTVDADAAQNG